MNHRPNRWLPSAALLAAALLLCGPAPATAQVDTTATGPADTTRADTTPADTFTLPGIVVTATRVPLAREAVPTPVTVWTREELEQRGIRSVAEALAAVPAATVARAGSRGAQTSLFLRGGESDYVKVLIDGVAVNDPGGAFDYADLSTDQIERIEVVRGPVSVLYGSDAVSGVVQIFTRRAAGAPTVTAEVTGGRGQERAAAGSAAGLGLPASPDVYGLADARATVTGSTGGLSYAVGGSRAWSEGLYPFNSERDHATGTARVAWTPGPGRELAVSTRYSDSRSHFPTDGAGALTDVNARLDRRLWSTSVSAGIRLHDRVDARIRIGLVTRDQTSLDPQDGPADTVGIYESRLARELTRRSVDTRVDWYASELLAGTVLSAGLAWEDADAATSYSSASSFGPFQAEADFQRATIGYYAQALSRPMDGLHLTLGGRVDDSDTYGTFETFRVGATVEPVSGTRLKAAWGRGFKEPSFDQVFGSGFGDAGNPGLEPERSRSWEAGVEQELRGIASATLAATWFDQRFERLIQYTFSPPDPGDPNYFNVGAAASRGLELEARGAVGPLGIDASYTYLETEVLDPGLATDAGFVEGEPLLRRPAHSGSLTGRYADGAGSVALTITTAGEREDLDFAAGFPAPRVTLPAYTTVDLAAERVLPIDGPVVTALLRVENALDTEYQSVAGFPGLGRVVRIGLRFRTR